MLLSSCPNPTKMSPSKHSDDSEVFPLWVFYQLMQFNYDKNAEIIKNSRIKLNKWHRKLILGYSFKPRESQGQLNLRVFHWVHAPPSSECKWNCTSNVQWARASVTFLKTSESSLLGAGGLLGGVGIWHHMSNIWLLIMSFPVEDVGMPPFSAWVAPWVGLTNNAQLKNSGTVIILVLLLVSGYYVGVG